MRIHLRYLKWVLLILVLWALVCAPATAGDDAVKFSGKVKKVLTQKGKVAVQDPTTKKRFSIVVDGKTKFEGFGKIGELKKGDAVSGSYSVNESGAYMTLDLKKE